MPKSEPGEPIFKALTKLGLELPEHSTQIASSISSNANYDQIAFLPETSQNGFTGLKGVFDFDAAIFSGLWKVGERQERQDLSTLLHVGSPAHVGSIGPINFFCCNMPATNPIV